MKSSIKFYSMIIVLLITAAVPTMAEDYKVDGVHSFVLFKIKHMDVGNVYGMFKNISGEITFDADNLSTAKIDVTVLADSVDSANAGRDKHLKSEDFFNARQFPTIKFISRKIEKSGNNFKAIGDLTLHGITKEISAEFEIIGSKPKLIGAEAVFQIKRSDFGMKFMLDKIGDDVTVKVAIEARGK